MSELKACPVCDKDAQEFFGYDYGLVGCKNEDCNYSFRPQHPDDWNNRPYEDKLKAEAIQKCLSYAMSKTVVVNTVYVKDVMEAMSKLERGEL